MSLISLRSLEVLLNGNAGNETLAQMVQVVKEVLRLVRRKTERSLEQLLERPDVNLLLLAFVVALVLLQFAHDAKTLGSHSLLHFIEGGLRDNLVAPAERLVL